MFLLATEQNSLTTMEQIRLFIENTWGNVLKVPVEFTLIFLIIYTALRFLRGTRAANVLAGLVGSLIGINLIASSLHFEVFNWLLAWIWTFFATALIVIFQPELRRAFAQVAVSFKRTRQLEQKEAIEEVVGAVMQMSFRCCGALIVFEQKIGLAAIINRAVVLDAKINSLLLQSLFYPNSPLHDGAVIVRGDTICAAHAILPIIQEDFDYAKSVGTRHRAALGVTEESDAVALVVSEESGTISVAYKGHLVRNLSETDLLFFLKRVLLDSKQESMIYDKFESLKREKICDLHQTPFRQEGYRS